MPLDAHKEKGFPYPAKAFLTSFTISRAHVYYFLTVYITSH